MRLSRVARTGVVVALVAGCGGSSADDGGAGETAASVTVTVEADETGGDGPTVVFEEAELEEGLVAPIPVGWAPHEFLEWEFEAPDDAGFDLYRPSYWVSLQCAGACESRTSEQWAEAVEQSLYSTYRDPESHEIVRDEVGADGALLETYRFGWTDLQIARWADGAEKIVTCHITLHEEHAELLADFEAACLAAESPVLIGG